MLVRLLQQFSTIELAQEVAPKTKPPPGYMESPIHNGKEKVWFRSHLTTYANVSVLDIPHKFQTVVNCESTQNGLWVRMGEAALDKE